MDIRIKGEGPQWCSVSLFLPEVDEAVSGLWLREHQMRVGGLTLRMSGIAGVGTKEEHRKQGYARQVMTRAIEYMAEEGYDVSMLFGIRDFYPKFGFVATPFDYRVDLSTQGATNARPTFQFRPLEEKDIPVIRKMYELNTAMRSGSVLRSANWDGFERGSRFNVEALPYVVIDDLDQVVGYFVWDDTEEHSTVSEAEASHPTVWQSMIHAFAQRARKLDHQTVRLLVPPDHPLTLACKPYGCQIHMGCPADGGGMMRIINLHSTFRKLLPEFTARWRRLDVGWQGIIRFCTDIGTICLRLDPTGIDLAEPSAGTHALTLPQTALTQMLIGYRTASEIQWDEGVEIPAAILPWLDALFPASYPYIWWSDRF